MTRFLRISAKLVLTGVLAFCCGMTPARGQQHAATPPPPAKKTTRSAHAASRPMAAKAPAKPVAAAKARSVAKAKPKAAAARKPAQPAKPVEKRTQGAPAPAPAKTEKSAEAAVPVETKRDPFTPLLYQNKGSGGPQHLPPGEAGLVVSTVRIDGTVQKQNQMIAVVSNPEQKVYFIREGDRLYDGEVEKIDMDGVTFKETSKDAFGKPVERTVTKRIYAIAGESQ